VILANRDHCTKYSEKSEFKRFTGENGLRERIDQSKTKKRANTVQYNSSTTEVYCSIGEVLAFDSAFDY